MNIHKNARLTVHGRVHINELSTSSGVSSAAAALGVSTRTATKWRRRFYEGGMAALPDRSSRPHHSPASLGPRLTRWVRRLRRWCHWTMRNIAWALEISLTSVWRICAAVGLSRLRPPAEPIKRYERDQPGELLHMDTKKLMCIGGRGSGHEVMHVAIDDHSRVAFVQILPDETKYSAIAFLKAAVAFFERQRVHIQRLLTDNGSAYWSRDFAAACADLEIKQRRGDNEKLRSPIKLRQVAPLDAREICDELVRHQTERYLSDVEFMLRDKIQQQIEWAIEDFKRHPEVVLGQT